MSLILTSKQLETGMEKPSLVLITVQICVRYKLNELILFILVQAQVQEVIVTRSDQVNRKWIIKHKKFYLFRLFKFSSFQFHFRCTIIIKACHPFFITYNQKFICSVNEQKQFMLAKTELTVSLSEFIVCSNTDTSLF